MPSSRHVTNRLPRRSSLCLRSVRTCIQRWAPLLLLALVATFQSACGGGSGRGDIAPFVVVSPLPPTPGPVITPPTPDPVTPAPDPVDAVWEPNAFAHNRTALFGSFPSDIVQYGNTLFVSDADQIEGGGARIVPIDISGASPTPSAVFAETVITAADLIDSQGSAGDVAAPVGFGFFLNDLLIASPRLGFAIVNAGGSDSVPTLSNLVAFDPQTGSVLQVVDLATTLTPGGPVIDSTGTPIGSSSFVQSGAEAVAYVPGSAPGLGTVYVAMSNLVFGAPSYGAVKLPGTLQAFAVDTNQALPLQPFQQSGAATRTRVTGAFNPVALNVIQPSGPSGSAPRFRILVTLGGTTGYDGQGQLVPVTNAAVEAYDAATLAFEGSFHMGLTGLGGKPAIGQDAVGNRIGYFPSSVTGQVYALRLDGLFTTPILPDLLAVLRGPSNGIPLTQAESGGPGGNITGVGLSPDGRTLVVAGFGDLFAFPDALPGQLFLLNLPDDMVSGSIDEPSFVPGQTRFATTPGRTLGGLVVMDSNMGSRPAVYVNVGGPLDPNTFLGTAPASLGTLETSELIP